MDDDYYNFKNILTFAYIIVRFCSF